MTKSLFALLLLSQSLYAIASEQSTCTANKGAYITGTVVSAPKFAAASTTIEGVKLTHTRLNLRANEVQGGPLAGSLGYSPDLPFSAVAVVNADMVHAKVQTGQFTPEGVERKNLWFAGFYPAQKPKYTIVVLQDGQTDPAYSSAAVFARLCTALRLLG